MEQVDVLVLVDGDRSTLRAELLDGIGRVLVEAHEPFQDILEVDPARSLFALLVAAVDAKHHIRWKRGLVAVETAEVVGRRDPAVLGPLDLGRELR